MAKPPKSKETLGLSGQGEWRHILAYAPPGWALFEVRVGEGGWKVNEWNSGVFLFDDPMQAMDEFVVLCLRFPNARVYFEDELGNEREQSWLEYALHRLGDKLVKIAPGQDLATDEQLARWGYTDRDERARDAIRIGIEAIKAWKAEEEPS